MGKDSCEPHSPHGSVLAARPSLIQRSVRDGHCGGARGRDSFRCMCWANRQEAPCWLPFNHADTWASPASTLIVLALKLPHPAQPGCTWPLHKPVLVEIWEPSKGAQGVTGDEHDLASHLAKECVLTQGDQASHFDPLILLAGQLVLTVA